MNKLSRFIELSGLEKRSFTQALLLLPLSAIAMRIYGFWRVYSFLVRNLSPSFENRRGEDPVSQELDPPRRQKAWRAGVRRLADDAVTPKVAEGPVSQELDPPKREMVWRAELRDAVLPTATGVGRVVESPLLKGVASESLPGCVPNEPLTTLELKNPLPSCIEARANCVARAVKLAANHGPYRANCLKQSLVIWWLLQRHGVESILRIGVRKETAGLEAHAWVECLGHPLNEGEDIQQCFSPFPPMSYQEVNWI